MTTPPKSFRVIGTIALVWNLVGLGLFVMYMTMSPETMVEIPEAERALYEDLPAWHTAAYAVAVICGTLGCIALLLKKAVALQLFVISLAAVIVQMGYSTLGTELLDVMGPTSLIMPVVITAIAVFLAWYSNSAMRKNWIS